MRNEKLDATYTDEERAIVRERLERLKEGHSARLELLSTKKKKRITKSVR